MKKLLCLLALVYSFGSGFSQNENGSVLNRGYSELTFAFGNKSHVGNLGLSFNMFLFKNLGIKASLGYGMLNYNGGIASIGPEFRIHVSKNFYAFFNSVFTYAGKSKDILGDDDSPDYIWYFTTRGQYIRPCIGLARVKSDVVIKLEIGYSYALINPGISYGGPGTPTAKQMNDVTRATGSGFSFCLSIGGIKGANEKKTD